MAPPSSETLYIETYQEKVFIAPKQQKTKPKTHS